MVRSSAPAVATVLLAGAAMLTGIASAQAIGEGRNDAVTSRESQPLEIAPVERELVERINAERQREGRAALAIDARLMDVAAAHSIDMAGSGAFSHQGSGSSGPEDRVQDAGYRWRYIAENIGCGQDSPARIVASWMQSSGHRENLLSAEARDIGVGLATRKDSRCGTFWTAVFADEQRR